MDKSTEIALFEAVNAMKEELKCAVCLSLLKNPSSLPCNHFFCNACVERALQTSNGNAACPLCKTAFSRRKIMKDDSLCEVSQLFTDLYATLSDTLHLVPMTQEVDFKPFVPPPRPPRPSLTSLIDDESSVESTASTVEEEVPVEAQKHIVEETKALIDESKVIRTKDGATVYLWTPYYNLPTEMDDTCQVCLREDTTEENAILYCDKCDMAVHQECYGVTSIPEGNWYCDPCTDTSSTIFCQVCPNKDDRSYLRCEGGYIHVNCAYWLPEPSFSTSGIEIKGPVRNISRIDPDRYQLRCCFCRSKVGACLQCDYKSCSVSYHASCAIRNGCRFELRDWNKTIYYHQFCRHHLEQTLLSPTNNAIPATRTKRPQSQTRRRSTSTKRQKQNPSIVLLCTKLNSAQMGDVQTFCRRFDATVVRRFDDSVTHVVTDASSSDHHFESRTLKYLFGLMKGVWIMCHDWILHSLEEERLASVAEFQVTSDIHTHILPRESRPDRSALFANCQFEIHDKVGHICSTSDLEMLIQRGDGVIAPTYAPRRPRKFLVHADQSVYYSSKEGIEIVTPKWIFDCMSTASIPDQRVSV